IAGNSEEVSQLHNYFSSSSGLFCESAAAPNAAPAVAPYSAPLVAPTIPIVAAGSPAVNRSDNISAAPRLAPPASGARRLATTQTPTAAPAIPPTTAPLFK